MWAHLPQQRLKSRIKSFLAYKFFKNISITHIHFLGASSLFNKISISDKRRSCFKTKGNSLSLHYMMAYGCIAASPLLSTVTHKMVCIFFYYLTLTPSPYALLLLPSSSSHTLSKYFLCSNSAIEEKYFFLSLFVYFTLVGIISICMQARTEKKHLRIHLLSWALSFIGSNAAFFVYMKITRCGKSTKRHHFNSFVWDFFFGVYVSFFEQFKSKCDMHIKKSFWVFFYSWRNLKELRKLRFLNFDIARVGKFFCQLGEEVLLVHSASRWCTTKFLLFFFFFFLHQLTLLLYFRLIKNVFWVSSRACIFFNQITVKKSILIKELPPVIFYLI